MKAIVVVDNNWAIGKDNKLLAHVSSDLKYFKEKTFGKKIVIGRKTLESFPGGKPLPGRENIVLTSNPENIKAEGCTICTNLEDLKKISGDVFVCGGESVYRQLMDDIDTVFVTKLYKSFDADNYFHNLDEDPDFEMTWQDEIMHQGDLEFRFTKYERTK